MKVPDRIFVELFNRVSVCVKKSIHGDAVVGVMGRHVVGHHATRNADATHDWTNGEQGSGRAIIRLASPLTRTGHSGKDPTLSVLDRSFGPQELLQYCLTAMPVGRGRSAMEFVVPISLDDAFVLDTVHYGRDMSANLDRVISGKTDHQSASVLIQFKQLCVQTYRMAAIFQHASERRDWLRVRSLQT